MRKKCKVFWSKIAENDLTDIIEYIAVDSRTSAVNIFNKIKVKISLLSFSPERGRVVPELKKFGILQFCELIISPWRIIYRVSEKNVYVLSVIDLHRNVEDILLKRLIASKK